MIRFRRIRHPARMPRATIQRPGGRSHRRSRLVRHSIWTASGSCLRLRTLALIWITAWISWILWMSSWKPCKAMPRSARAETASTSSARASCLMAAGAKAMLRCIPRVGTSFVPGIFIIPVITKYGIARSRLRFYIANIFRQAYQKPLCKGQPWLIWMMRR